MVGSTQIKELEILCVIPKSADAECRVRLMSVDGVEYIEFRDWLRTKEKYGRGYWIPADRDTALRLASALLNHADRDDA